MANMDEKMTCEVVQDLLPLYVDGVCTEGSKKLVEEHIKTCEGCKKQVEEMGVDTTLFCPVSRVETESERVLKYAMKKLKTREIIKRVIAVCLAVLLAVPACVLFNREMTAEGLSLSNYDEYRRTKTVVDLWVEQGGARAVEALDLSALYAHLCKPMENYELVAKYGIDRLGVEGTNVAAIELNGETYYFPGGLFWQDNNTGTQGDLDQQALYEAGDELGLLHSLMINFDLIVTEQTGKQLQAAYDAEDPGTYFPVELGDATYYYYAMEPINFEGDMAFQRLGYPSAIKEVLGALDPIPEDYCKLLHYFGHRAMPEPLWELFSETYQTILGNFQSFERHYLNVGYQGYATQYLQDLGQLLTQLEELGVKVTEAKMTSIGATTYLRDVHSTQVTWVLLAGDVWLDVRFYVKEDACHLVEITGQGALTSQQKALLNEINKIFVMDVSTAY